MGANRWSGTIRADNALYGGQTTLTLNQGFVTAFGGVRVPLGVPNLYLYGTVGARNFYSGKLTVSGPFGLFNGTETVNKDGSIRSPASPRSIATTIAGS